MISSLGFAGVLEKDAGSFFFKLPNGTRVDITPFMECPEYATETLMEAFQKGPFITVSVTTSDFPV